MLWIQILYWVKQFNLNPISEPQSCRRYLDFIMSLLLPASFIALKLTGTIIDFLLSLSNTQQPNFPITGIRN